MNQSPKSEAVKNAWSTQKVPTTSLGMRFPAMSSEVVKSPSGAMRMANWRIFAKIRAVASGTPTHMTKALAFHSATPSPQIR